MKDQTKRVFAARGRAAFALFDPDNAARLNSSS
jgi:hypothetical protein